MILSLMSLLLFAPAQDRDCNRPTDCRTLLEYPLKVNGKTIVVDGGAVVPWVQDGVLVLFVGESAVVDVESDKPVVESVDRASEVMDDDQVRTFLGVMAGANDELPRNLSDDSLRLNGPDGRLRISFRQGAGVEDMILIVENGYEGALSYRAMMMAVGPNGQTQWAPTSVCTVQPGIHVFEHWPHPIVAMALEGFEIAPKGQAVETICL